MPVINLLRVNGQPIMQRKPAPVLTLRDVVLDALRTINSHPPLPCCDSCASITDTIADFGESTEIIKSTADSESTDNRESTGHRESTETPESIVTADVFEESKHPRDEGGQFSFNQSSTKLHDLVNSVDLQHLNGRKQIVPLSKITATIPAVMSERNVKRLQQAYTQGQDVPPPKLLHHNGEYALIDGHHRVEALHRNGTAKHVHAVVLQAHKHFKMPVGDAFKESDHPRGQPDNAGQFGSKPSTKINESTGAPESTTKSESTTGLESAAGTDPKTLADIANDPKKMDALSNSAHKLGIELSGDVSDISKEARKVISAWTDPSGYKRINNHLRGTKTDPKTQKDVEVLQESIFKHSLPEAVNAYRGVHGPLAEELNKLKKGGTFTSKGFMATTIDPKRATHYVKAGTGELIHMVVPEGAPALYVSNPDLNSWTAERELLLPYGSEYRYLGSEDIELPQYNYSGELVGKAVKVKMHHVEPVLGNKGAMEAAKTIEPTTSSWTPPKTNDAWDKLAYSGPDFKEPKEFPMPAGIRKQGAGVLIQEPDGRVWVVTPSHGFGGFKNTFPKGGIEPGMTARGTALKEAFEESGLGVELTGFAGDIRRSDSVCRYYFAKRVGGDPSKHGWESEDVKLVEPDKLADLFNMPADMRVAGELLGAPLKDKHKKAIASYVESMTAIPKPHKSSSEQAKLHAIADKSDLPVADRIKQIESLKIPKGGYTEHYKYQVLRGLSAQQHYASYKATDVVAKASDTHDVEFEESKHPRDNSGKFGSGGGGATALHEPRVLKGDPMNRGFVTTVKVNPTPDEISDILDKHEEEGKRGTIRVVSAPNGNIGVADGHTTLHIDLMMLLADEFDPNLERDDDDVFEHDWILSVQPRGPHTYDLQGRQVKVTYYKEADGYETGKPVNPKPDKWPEGLRRAFGITGTSDTEFEESKNVVAKVSATHDVRLRPRLFIDVNLNGRHQRVTI